jgi:predicted AlkP superfamily pyrophosphatase or phosphodiesterase
MRLLSFLFVSCLALQANAQKTKTPPTNLANNGKPKLVVGIVVDQMRWDYVNKFKPFFKSQSGFMHFINEGATCDNTLIPYVPTVTACGHTCAYTGSVPALHGIAGNMWYDNVKQKSVYCVEDASVQTVGSSNNAAGQMSPLNVWTTTIGDELKLATNFKSKVIGPNELFKLCKTIVRTMRHATSSKTIHILSGSKQISRKEVTKDVAENLNQDV